MSDKYNGGDFDQRLGELLLVFSDIAAGDLRSRCSTALPITHPLGALFIGVNEMLDALEAESQRRANYQRELEEKLATIRSQNDFIRQLSTPLIEVWDRVLCLPVIGRLDDDRRAHILTSLLETVVSKRARCVIIDVTGTEIPDGATAQLFVRMIGAVRLLGAQCVLTGVSPALAAELIRIGASFEGVSSHPTLSSALKAIMKS